MKNTYKYSPLFLLAFLLSLHGYGQKFKNPLVIPDTLSGPIYSLSLDTTHYNFSSDIVVPTNSFNRSGYLGPTIIWKKGTIVTMNVKNNLTDTTTVHWHGAHVPSVSDGGPNTPIAPGKIWSPSFQILDDPTTFWYHPHLHHQTQKQVQNGLAGMIILKDDADPFQKLLPHTYGKDDFPIILQDRSFIPSTGNHYNIAPCSMGDTMVVNGTLYPYLQVPAQMVRFRILNGSGERMYNLRIDSADVKLIATDAGYIEAPLAIDTMLQAPGERAEWVVDFTGKKGKVFYLKSFPGNLGTDIPGAPNGGPPCDKDNHNISGKNFSILKIIVGDVTENAVTTLPSEFRKITIPDTNKVARTRVKHFIRNTAPTGPPFSIDGIDFNHHLINDTIYLNDIEKWTIANTSAAAHPFHIHDIHFYLLNFERILDTGKLKQYQQLQDYQKGPKDVVMIPANTKVTFITQFTTFATEIDPHLAYMYHCHILPHEDDGMMHQFVVTNRLTAGIADKKESGFKIFPNPAHGEFKIEGNCDTQSKILITDLRGVRVYDGVIPPVNGNYSVSDINLAPGLYNVHWMKDDSSIVESLIIR